MQQTTRYTRLLTLLAVCLWSPALVSAQVSFGKARLMNDNWRFLHIDSTQHIYEQPEMKDGDYDDASWRRLSLPHDWSIEQPMSPDKGSCQGYLPGGIGWYRKVLPAEGAKGKRFIYFEGAYNYSEVYVNGHLLGCRPSGFASFMYDLTPYLRADGRNVIAVRVNHNQENDSRWYTGSGIYRNVWLIEAPEVHLAQWGTAYRLTSINNKRAVVEVDIETTDERPDKTSLPLKAIVKLIDAHGNTVATGSTAIKPQEKKTVRLTINRPHRWNLDDPYLYTLTTTLSAHDEEIDASTVKAGLRTLDFSADKGFALNGKWMKVKGVCLHDDAGVLGTAVPKEVWRRRIQELKAIGVNAIRMSHNPHAPELYDLCDELGMLVMDEASDEWEFPKRKWLKGWNKGVPGFQGTYTYFEEWIERDVADMVRRDRCHPSVFMWSIGNEVDYPNDPYSHPVLNGNGTDFTQPAYGGYKPEQPNAERIGRIAERLAKVVKAIDTSRPTTGALAGVVMSNETAYPGAIDVVGYNYTESRYDIDHERYPQRVIYGSENRHDMEAWRAVRDKEHIFGQFLWTGIDYLGESGPWPARGSSAGLLDLAGQRKPSGWYRAALWSDKPVCFIQMYPLHRDNRTHGQQRVTCFTNASTAQLLIDGKPVDSQMQRDEQTDMPYWDIDYRGGTLRCVASNGAYYEIPETKAPHALRLSTDSVAHLFVEVVDEQGNVVRQADNEVTIRMRGAQLLGLENGNMMDPTVNARTQKNRLRVLNGRLVGYFHKAKGAEAVITATAPFLQSAEIKIQ
ncbi:glycoside hydrolase family 2 [Prevotella sp. E13-17]|uniref:glycoside hydrolase family 2 TIM barrel-domain containing protein n=1 Tax=Prevotella sp. E13-17 TaxID=2913616 RepID=UPI001EDBA19A|nr:glycoside hydrolase family 2 TIM barrel-domain containing protein [Prevotella sp. E13-17]UKK51462.1 glycoside hydrolase family 2 [Prevotella sp. E13-17]